YKRQPSIPTNYHWQTRLEASWSFASRLAWSMQNSWAFLQDTNKNNLNHYEERWRQIVQPGDTIRSIVYCDASNSSSGDLRLAAGQYSVTTGFNPHPDYDNAASKRSRACLLRLAQGTMYFPPGAEGK